jgi:hypothetical protein
MTITVTFLNPDDELAAIVRALAAKAAGYQVVSGATEAQLRQQGFYSFEFSQRQLDRFIKSVERYIAEAFRKLICISHSDT